MTIMQAILERIGTLAAVTRYARRAISAPGNSGQGAATGASRPDADGGVLYVTVTRGLTRSPCRRALAGTAVS